MFKILKWSAIILLIIILGLVIYIYSNLKDRNPGYEINLNIKPTIEGPLYAGFGVKSISPQVPDTWEDINNDAQYNPKDGDTYNDGNENGKFDAVWMAGFDNKRAANGIHDDLWARTMIIDDGSTRLAIVSLDAIGFFHDEVIDVRKRISPDAGITYAIIASTHTHEAPDLMGLWGASDFKSGIDPEYIEYVKSQTVLSIEEAAKNLQPAIFRFARNLSDLSHLVTDTRKPIVMDAGLLVMQAINKETQLTLGSLVAWADHPETLWSDNLQITSDFPHYVREGVEKGIYINDSLLIPGIGGTAIYMNGAIGGLMTTHPDLSIVDPWTGETFLEPSFEKAWSQGNQIAAVSLLALQESSDTLDQGNLSLIAKTIHLPMDNSLFRIGASLGLFDRGLSGWITMRTELSLFSIGPASFATFPGEIYPEIINGGIDTPVGQDIDTDPVEIPPIRQLMKGKYKFIFGMANDELGYIIPKSEWDVEAPYIYEAVKSPYGEDNSLGPDTAPILHGAFKLMATEFYK